MINTEVNLKNVIGDFFKKLGFSNYTWYLFSLNENLI